MSKQEDSDHMLLKMGVGSDDSLAAFSFVITHPTIHVAYKYEILCGPILTLTADWKYLKINWGWFTLTILECGPIIMG